MSIVIDCNENILRAFPMLSTPAWQFMCTGCVFQALQALNRPVRCKEIREWFNDNIGFPRDITVEMIAACCLRLVKMGLAKREEIDEGTLEIPLEDWCLNYSADLKSCQACGNKCKFNDDHTKLVVKNTNAYYSLV